MEHVWDKHTFCEAALAAQPIFSYLRTHSALRGHQLDFEYGIIDDADRRGIVKFSCRDRTSPLFGSVWVSAGTGPDGSWVVKHALGTCP